MKPLAKPALQLLPLMACVSVLNALAQSAAAPDATPAAAAAASAASAPAPRTVYQQRGANGQVVFTDRPSPGMVTERRWEIDPEDPQAALGRRDAVREQADRVSERVQRSIELQQQRSNELQIEQLRAQQAADALKAERLREREFESLPYVILPARPGGRPPVGRPEPRPEPPRSIPPGALPDPTARIGPRRGSPADEPGR